MVYDLCHCKYYISQMKMKMRILYDELRTEGGMSGVHEPERKEKYTTYQPLKSWVVGIWKDQAYQRTRTCVRQASISLQ
jgi:hypothetical protein